MTLPTFHEASLYLRTQGLRATVQKALAAYVVGRLTWNVTIEDLTQWVGAPLMENGLEIRPARRDDLGRMGHFHSRQPADILERWLGPDFFFFIALAAGDPISYRCLSKRVAHPAVVEFLHLRDHQLFMVDEFTAVSYRRRGITRQLAVATNPPVLAQGYRHVVGLHRPDNLDTIAATRAKGIPTIGTLRRYRLGPKTWITYSPRQTSAAPQLAMLEKDVLWQGVQPR
jgi:hypothetical protein